MMSIRSGIIGLGIFAFLTAVYALALPAGQPGSDPPLTAEQKSKLKERDQIEALVKKLFAEHKFEESVPLIEKMIALERLIFGDVHEDLVGSFLTLSLAHTGRGDSKAAHTACSEALRITRLLHGDKHWKTTDARERLADVDRFAKLTASQRKQVNQLKAVPGQAAALRKKGKFAEADRQVLAALAMFTKLMGENHSFTGTLHGELALIRGDQSHFAEAEKLYAKALDIYRKTVGEDHPSTAVIYSNMAFNLRQQHRYLEAEQLDRKALGIRLRVLGEGHPDTAGSFTRLAGDLSGQAQAHRQAERHAEAEKLHRQALEIVEKTLGKEHHYTATVCHELARDLHDLAKFAEAEELNRKALAIYRKVKGEEHPWTAASYDNIAYNLRGQGRFAEAEKADAKALAIHIKALGETHANTASSYNNLARDRSERGKYAEAELMYRKALKIRLTLHGENHPSTLLVMSNLAVVLSKQGRHSEGEELERNALSICRKLLGNKHSRTAGACLGLARCLPPERYTEAEHLEREALSIYRKTKGEKHPSTAESYNNLAGTMRRQGKYEEAEELLRKALDIRGNVLGEQHPETLRSLNNLVTCLVEEGKEAAAEELGQQVVMQFIQALGEHHPSTALAYLSLGYAQYNRGNFAKAEDSYRSSATAFETVRLEISFTGMGRSLFAAERTPLAFLAAVLARNGKPREAWEYLEKNMGRGLFDDLSVSGRALKPDERNKQEALGDQLAALDKQLERKLGAKELALLKEKRTALIGKQLQLQADLQAKYGQAAGAVYDLKRIQAALRPDAALVRWVDFPGNSKAKNPSGEHWGVVVRHEGPPVWIKLNGSGPEGAWTARDDEILQTARRQLQNPDPTFDWEEFKTDLARQRLRPLEEHLDGIKHLIVLPSTAQAGIPVEAYSDRFLITYAPSGTIYAWLQEQRRKRLQPGGNLLALADPLFSAKQTKISLGTKEDALRRLVRGQNLKSLPGTRAEVEAIARQFAAKGGQVQKLLGAQASSENLDQLARKKELARFRYLHLATHGFADPRGGMNSYLALTPAHFDLASHDKLSARHILRTWQLEADLVTLSACQTGLGEYQGGEGYVGFAQALFLTGKPGARTLVLSQWQVNDWATTLLMERFYQNLLGQRPGLKTPLGKAEALAEGRRWLRALPRNDVKARLKDLGIFQRLKDEGRNDPERFVDEHLNGEQPFAHPHFWAAFILIGDPGREGARTQ